MRRLRRINGNEIKNLYLNCNDNIHFIKPTKKYISALRPYNCTNKLLIVTKDGMYVSELWHVTKLNELVFNIKLNHFCDLKAYDSDKSYTLDVYVYDEER